MYLGVARILIIIIIATGGLLGMPAQNATNGVYGGYVGSDRWFAMMRSSAQNQAVMMSLARTSDPQKLPADYVEFAGQITFPDGGNPFPGKRFPDLRIVCRDKSADDVERAPFIDEEGGFYTVFKKGQTYDVFWMYYFGSREQFGSITIPANAPKQYRSAMPYTAPKTTGSAPPQSAGTAAPAAERKPSPPPPNANRFDTSGLPRTPTNFEEQQLADIVREDGTSAFSHDKLAAYYEKKGDTKRAEAEREKAKYWRNPFAYEAPSNSGNAPASAPDLRQAAPLSAERRPNAPPDANRFDMSGVPRTPTTFEEQQLALLPREDGTSWYSHEKLAAYYEKKGDTKRANAEYEKAKYWKNPSAYAALSPSNDSVVAASAPGRGDDSPRGSDVDVPPPTVSIPDRATSVAVVIGISQYREKDIPQVPFAKRDSESVAGYLQNVAGIRRENIKMLSDNGATRSDIEEVVEQWLPRHTTDTSAVVFYYAGHGALDPATGETYLVPHEGHPESPTTRMYPLKRLYEKLEALPAKNITVFLDSCFSGGGRSIAMRGRPIVITSDNISMNSGKLAILSAASANQISSDLDRTGHGLFTYFLLKGIRGEADTSRDGWVDLYELSAFVKTNVNSTAVSELNREQNPVLLGGTDVESRARNLKLFRVSK